MIGPKNRFSQLAVSLAALALLSLSAHAQSVTLTNLNSTATINLNGSGTSAGMIDWTTDGFHNLSQQWFWFRTGSMTHEDTINSIGGISYSSPDSRTLYTSYFNGQYGVTVDYLLTGFHPGTGLSDISENISITNATANPLEFHFFQYSDFKLGGTPQNTLVQLFRNVRGQFWGAALDKTDPAFSFALSETVVSPAANHGEAAVNGFTYGRLTDSVPTTLNDNTGPVGGGLDDATWAFEWDFIIAPGSSVGISKDKYLQIIPVPEPAAVALVGVAAAAFVIWRRGRS